MRAVKAFVLIVLLAPLGVAASPAGASIGVSVSGTTLNITVIGPETVSFGCVGGTVRVSGQTTSPTVACNALTKVTVLADDSAQRIDGDDLDAAAFSAGPFVELTTLGGADVVRDTLQADWISTGFGADTLIVKAEGTANTLVNVGDDSDTLLLEGTSSADGVYVGALGPNATVQTVTTNGTRTNTFQQLDAIRVHGYGGDDGLSTVDVTPGSTLTALELDGGDGDDGLLSGPVGARLRGGAGMNTLSGGFGADIAFTASPTDTVGLGEGQNLIVDATSLRAGGRIHQADADGRDTYVVEHPATDTVVRVRPVGSGASVTSSLSRSGRQDIGVSFAGAQASFGSETNGRHLVDAVLSNPSDGYRFDLDTFDDDLVDITIPTGGWATSGTLGQTYTVNPNAGGIGTVTTVNAGAVSVHGPWPNPQVSLAHRVVRDLLLRFPSDVDRTALAARLTGGTSRATIAAELTGTDEYRGLDVDRIFVQYLRRRPDAGGRTYWIDSIEGGNPLWRVRAQVFGSPEYFANAGGTNAAFVRAAYADVLGRLPDAAGQQYWVDRLAAGDLRSVVAKQFLTVVETRNRVVDDQFLRFLDRPATTAERATWSPRMNEAGGEQALIRFLAASNAYYQRT